MEVWVTAQPHLLYETVELLYAYVNRIPAVELTQEGPYCLPEAAIQQMLDVACAGISQDDPEIQYDFGKYILSEDPERATCVARNLVYNSMEPSGGDLAADCARLCQARQRQRRNRERMVDIDEYRLIYLEPADSEFVPLAQEIAKLGLGPEYAQKLLEQFSGFVEAMDQLKTILTPVAEKLRPLLAPWAHLAEPLARSWESYFLQPDGAMAQAGSLHRGNAVDIYEGPAPLPPAQVRPGRRGRRGWQRLLPHRRGGAGGKNRIYQL